MAREYSTEDLQRMLGDPERRFFLVDTLPAAAYTNRHLPGAISVPLDEIPAAAERIFPDRNVEIIAYCSSLR